MMNSKEMNAARATLIECRRNTGRADETVAALVEKLGYEDAREIVAAMVNAKGDWDQRISDRNRAWAADLAQDRDTLAAAYIYYCDDIHPAHMDQIADAMRKFQPSQEPAPEADTAAALNDVLTWAKGLLYDSTSMALDLICEKLISEHGLNATFSGRSVYIDDERVASIKTATEPCVDCKVIGIYDFTVLVKEEKTVSKKPKARVNADQSITKAVNNCRAFIEQSAAEALMLHVSAGNMKLGAIMNISLPPVVTCHNCSSCKNYCYAVRTYNRFTSTAAGWNDNYLLFLTDPVTYFEQISDAVKMQRFFRWHVSGDIVNERYLAGMIRVARENPKCEFLAFTKAYEIVNAAIAAGAVIPGNLHVLFSAAPGVDMPNPYRLPECHINFADPALNTYHGGAEYVHHCGGNCTECAINGCGCFFLKTGDVTVINQH